MIYFFILTISYIVVFLVTPSVRYLALNFYVIDEKNFRKIHKKVVAKLGGLAIYFGFLGGLIIAAIFDVAFLREHNFQIAGFVASITLMLMLGIYDDLQGSGAFIKLVIQTIIAVLLMKTGFRLEGIFIPGLIDIRLGILSFPLTLLWLVGITNAINLLDGLDGLASGIVACVCLFFSIYGLLLGEKFIIFISVALMGANMAFLRYNFYPAKIFLGDTGSLFLGFAVAALAIYRPTQETFNNPFFLPACVVLLLPILDTILAVIRRTLRKQYIFASDFSHIHHYYIKLGFSQVCTVKRFYLMTIFLGIASLSIIYSYLRFLGSY